MTGPRNFLVHPHRRRGRHCLPLLFAVLYGPLACSNDQATGPTPSAATVSHPVPKAAGSRMSSTGSPYRVYPSFSSSAGAPAVLMADGPSVLVLADTDIVSTNALATRLANGGLQVTVRPGPEYTWDGTNPSLAGFDVVVHLNGSTYELPLDVNGQTALADFVSNGGGYIGAKWNGFEDQPQLVNLALQGYGGDPMGPEQTCGFCDVTYETVASAAGHPVLAGLPASFTFTADGHDAGPQIEFSGSPSTVLMQVPSGRPAVLVRELGAGRVVNFSFAPNYYWDDLGNVRDPVTLQDSRIQQLYLNAVQWAAFGSGTILSQSITFEPLADRVYGDPGITVSATASSGLPVNFTSSGTCRVDGTFVALSGAGICTITAHQPGNNEYEPAADVSQSFQIHPAVPQIQWTPAPLMSGTPLGPSQLNATATGLGGELLSGTFTYDPPAGTSFAAGTVTLSTHFTSASPNYTGADHSVSITVSGDMSFTGFYAPIRNLPYVNTVMAGSAVPVKFSLGSYRGLEVLQGGAPTSVPVECPAGALVNTLRPGIAATSSLQAVGSNYTYTWKTSPSWAGTCRRLVVTLIDGSTHEALFRFTGAAPTTMTSNARRILRR